ncbi:MAG: purine-nucleoside phosphorylase [Bacteroidota bacterium]|jgi:purine-nucleoside phosphorylase
MSIHINAPKNDIAKIVLLAGDPLRAKFIADSFLDETKLVNKTRNMLYFTGRYKNKTISIGASGMGAPSMGIYSYELYTAFEVETIIRIGTCGAYHPETSLYELINVKTAVSTSNYALEAWGNTSNYISHQGNTYEYINQTAKKMAAADSKYKVITSSVYSSDVFYGKDNEIPTLATNHGCMAVEMETFALFANAAYLKRNAAALLTVSDNITTKQIISADEREKSLIPMIEIALETAVSL